MKRSLSGDKVHVHSFLTLKRGSPLVAKQGAVMRDLERMLPNHVPEIYWVGDTWYLMQTIKPSLAPAGHYDWKWDVAAISMGTYWTMPERWIYPDAPPFSVPRLYDYLETQGWGTMPHIPSPARLANKYGGIPRVTHGDLTHENTIIQRDRTYKFIDWQAQRHPYLPPHKDVDYGKLLQSLLGWDMDSGKLVSINQQQEIKNLLQVAPLAWFWCSIHFMRIKVRAKDDWLRAICDENIDYCFWLGEKEQVA
jgi:hypothetical protein